MGAFSLLGLVIGSQSLEDVHVARLSPRQTSLVLGAAGYNRSVNRTRPDRKCFGLPFPGLAGDLGRVQVRVQAPEV